MINILIKETDSLFILGIQAFFSDFFARRLNKAVTFLPDYSQENIALAEVIVLSFRKGERYTCFPELRERTKGVIIGLVDEKETHEQSPTCFADIVYINRHSSMEEWTDKIDTVWKKWRKSPTPLAYPSCLWCKNRQMSNHQLRIMAHIYQGKTVKWISSYLGISTKTIFSQKYLVRHKFNLRNDIELIEFLNVLAEKELNSTRFSLLIRR
ncbi:helix-turn-helix transcriptional regulator [Enterobacter bugandensis]|nr:helix-turn-helix transcriptional regulator [Enterobacter bugandensis]